MTELAINAFSLLFVVIDPISLAPLFSAMTRTATDSHRRKTAYKGVIIAGIILVTFTLLGDILLDNLNIEPASFSIAGGVLLFLIAIDMLFARQSGLRSTTVSEQAEAEDKTDISVFPLAIPLIAGPGAFTTLILLTDKPTFSMETCVILLMLLLVLLITFFMLFIATRVTGFLGETGTNVITRVLGIILAALAIQFIVDGMITSFPFLKSG